MTMKLYFKNSILLLLTGVVFMQEVDGQTEGKLTHPVCGDWENTKTAYDAARGAWEEPACYDFSYTFLGFQVGNPSTKSVQVRNGIVSGDGDKTVQDFFSLIESNCISNCPDDGAQKCTIVYDSVTNIPVNIYIDMSQYESDDEHIYRLGSYSVVECSASQLAVLQLEQDKNAIEQDFDIVLGNTPCTDWETTLSELNAAKSIWADPMCYDFSYTFRGYQVGAPEKMSVQVRNGQPVKSGGMTLPSLFDMIESLCISNCPNEGAQTCSVTYAAEGYPTSIFIDMSEYEADEERVYDISDFAIVECPEPSQSTIKDVTVRCANFELVRESYLEAHKKWSDPLCYDYSYETRSSVAVDVQVRGGVAIGNAMTINDHLRTIKRHCLNQCESPARTNDGMVHECQVSYDAVAGYPTNIEMDPSGEIEGDETVVHISNFRLASCQVEGYEDQFPVPSPEKTLLPTQIPGRLPYPYKPPSVSPSAEPSATEKPTTPELSRKEQARNYLASREISNLVDLETEGTPQNRALTWIADGDILRRPIPIRSDDAYLFDQRYVLAVLYYSLNGDGWDFPTGFLAEVSECDWNFGLASTDEGGAPRLGVHCNTNGQVSKLLMVGNKLDGVLPPEIGHLPSLEVVDLSHNLISGKVADSMGQLTSLTFLALEQNKLTGSIPAWTSNLKSLEYFAISGNSFTGELPTLIGLDSLQDFAANDNLLSGKIEPLSSLVSLQNIFLSDNAFTGPITDATFQFLGNLSIVDLSNNDLTGYFPAHFYKYDVVDLHGNSVSGELPEVELGGLSLDFLSVYGNKISGTFPSSILSLNHLRYLDLSSNDLKGSLPESFEDMKQLEYLFLSRNEFSNGSIPLLSRNRKLKEVSLKKTNRIAAIPDWFGALEDLVLLDLQENKLVGTVPESLGNVNGLRYLFLSNNQLTGSVPRSLGSLEALEILLLEKNDLEGDVEVFCSVNHTEALTWFGADCAEVTCSCCNICCVDSDHSCNSVELVVSFQSGYHREEFSFDNLEVIEMTPTVPPKEQPTVSDFPSHFPSRFPSDFPSDVPSDIPSDLPSTTPSDQPSTVPSDSPSMVPTLLAEPSIVSSASSLPSFESSMGTFLPTLPKETVGLREFVITVNAEGSWDVEEFRVLVEGYLARELQVVYENFARIELDVAGSPGRRKLQEVQHSVSFSGKVNFSGTPPDSLEVISEQMAALADTSLMQAYLENGPSDAKLMVTGVQIQEDNLPTIEPAGSPLSSGSSFAVSSWFPVVACVLLLATGVF